MAALTELEPTAELVGVAWLKSAVPYLENNVATVLPRERGGWAAKGFVTVYALGGDAENYFAWRNSVLSVSCWAVAEGSKQPPWNKAAQLAEQIRLSVVDHPNVPRALAMPSAGYRLAAVRTAQILQQPRRIYADEGDLAHYQLDLELQWISAAKP